MFVFIDKFKVFVENIFENENPKIFNVKFTRS